MAKYVALLRGINVGGNNRVPMKDLRRMFEEAGATDVASYIQSGNVVFTAKKSDITKINKSVTEAMVEELKVEVPLIFRSATEFGRAAAADPLGPSTEAQDKLRFIGFCSKKPSAAAIKSLDTSRSTTDTFAVIGSQVYLSVPSGMAKTKLSNAYFDKVLGLTTTFRNLRTVRILNDMLHS